jgi:hypothetical protein
MRFFFFLIINMSISSLMDAQNTIGLLKFLPSKVYPGYNLIFPHNQSNVFLLDNCGKVVHLWEGNAQWRPGNAVYLLEDGTLVKCTRPNIFLNDPIWAGGGGQRIEILSWDNELLHFYELNDSSFRLHHDAIPMKNGNILMIAWERKNYDEAISAGRNPDLLPQKEVWSEVILEWSPQLDSIVWKWHAWDHLIQQFDPTKNNYGKVADHPGKIDINYDESDGHPDWLHINAIDFHEELDQFVLSVPTFNEIWVIDHSTSIQEAASNVGGKSGKGGQLLFRWGNPAAYKNGDSNDKKLFYQHDIHWVNKKFLPGEEGFDLMAVFNNRVNPQFSEAATINTGFNIDTWSYDFSMPVDFEKRVKYPFSSTKIVSDGLSSVQILPNGNWLIMFGRWGFAFEITDDGEVVWEYIIPIKSGEPAVQGTQLSANQNLTFKLNRYGLDYPPFANKDLSGGKYLELNANEGFCENLVSSISKIYWEPIKIGPNPTDGYITIFSAPLQIMHNHLELYSLEGKLVRQWRQANVGDQLWLGDLDNGIYLLIGEQIRTPVIIAK